MAYRLTVQDSREKLSGTALVSTMTIGSGRNSQRAVESKAADKSIQFVYRVASARKADSSRNA